MQRRLFKCEQGDAFELERVVALVYVQNISINSDEYTKYTGYVAVIMSRVELMVPITQNDYERILLRRGGNA